MAANALFNLLMGARERHGSHDRVAVVANQGAMLTERAAFCGYNIVEHSLLSMRSVARTLSRIGNCGLLHDQCPSTSFLFSVSYLSLRLPVVNANLVK